jgi:ribose transport system substrate-binding protein
MAKLESESTRKRKRPGGVRYWLPCALAAAALVGAGCGSNSDSSGSTNSSGGNGPSQQSATKSKQARAADAGAKAATTAGGPIALKPRTIGVLQVVGAAETIQRDTNGIKQAAKLLGWKIIVCDGQGDPAKTAACGTTLLAQHPDAIVSFNVEAAGILPALKEAKAKNIPWVQAGGPAVPSPLFVTQVVEDENEVGTVMAQFLVDKLGAQGGTVATTEFPAILALKQRMAAFYSTLEKSPSIKVINKHTVDFANLTADVRSWSAATLTKNPDLSAFGLCVDSDPVAVASVVQSKKPGAQDPDRPLIVGSQGDLANLDLIRKGQVDAVSETAISATAWMSLDQIAEFFARQKAFSQNPRSDYSLDFLKAQLVTKANVPKTANTFVDPPEDFVKTKWAKEFTTS